MFALYIILLLRQFCCRGHCDVLMQLQVLLPVVGDGIEFFCCVRLLLILYLVGSCNLFLHCFDQIIYATCGVVGSAFQLNSRKVFLLLW